MKEKRLKKALAQIPYIEEKGLAILTTSDEFLALTKDVATSMAIPLQILKVEDPLHIQKRKLNESKHEYILYSSECYETVWELFNDGTTYLDKELPIEEIINKPDWVMP